MTPSLYARLAPAITVYSVFPAPQLQTASPLALRAAGLDAAGIESIMAARAHGQAAPGLGVPPGGPQPYAAAAPGTVFTVTAMVSAAGETVTRSETVRFTGHPADPVWILARTGT